MGAAPNTQLQIDDLMAVARVTIDDQETVDALAKNRALLWTAAIVVGFLSMFSLWAVVRYVIVKPVKHLRDVANAVREGDVEQRAVIRTGDEFEELAAAFNRMLRQLLSQQSELRHVNDELDNRLDELAQANMRLYEMNRLKSDFLATVSHELRTPLNSILGFSDVLSGIDALDDKQLRYVGNIQRSGRMLLEMINDILDLAKVESGKMEVRLSEFKINALVAAQCDMARPLAEKKNIDLDCDAPASLPPLRQDQAKVQQILNNLLSNAIKFTPEGGRIFVSAERDELGDLRLKVTDTGIGISPDEQQLVFEKFRQATERAARRRRDDARIFGHGLGPVDRPRAVPAVGRRCFAGKRARQRQHVHDAAAVATGRNAAIRCPAPRRPRNLDALAPPRGDSRARGRRCGARKPRLGGVRVKRLSDYGLRIAVLAIRNPKSAIRILL